MRPLTVSQHPVLQPGHLCFASRIPVCYFMHPARCHVTNYILRCVQWQPRDICQMPDADEQVSECLFEQKIYYALTVLLYTDPAPEHQNTSSPVHSATRPHPPACPWCRDVVVSTLFDCPTNSTHGGCFHRRCHLLMRVRPDSHACHRRDNRHASGYVRDTSWGLWHWRCTARARQRPGAGMVVA